MAFFTALGGYLRGILVPHRALERAEARPNQRYLAAAELSVSSCCMSSLAMALKLLLIR